MDQLEIRWPSGQVDVLSDIPVDQKIRVFEGREGYHVVQPTVWEVAPLDSLVVGETVDAVAVVRPALFEPDGEITQVTANLSSLGGPEDVQLEDMGDGTYHLEMGFVIEGNSALQNVVVFIEQETSLGPYWIHLTRHVTVLEAPVTAVLEDHTATLPQTFILSQNYPNPFNSSTLIRFALPTSADVNLTLYNLAGQKVATLAQGPHRTGTYTLHWDGRDAHGRALASGVYLYRLRAGGQVETRKLVLLR